MKQCLECKQIKEEVTFYPHFTMDCRIKGLQDICKICRDSKHEVIKTLSYHIYLNVRFYTIHLFITSTGISFYRNKWHKDLKYGRFALYKNNRRTHD